ncbi:UGSC family (seleno)protein [Phaeobacter italicus]|uniref:UGSC family (seleno)protein n=1 Tax=Phaeobacter italicus TaxID=481446 RepID=UPI00248DCBC6|nr:UGSC family (seleno)protein [Phaeobacter italicus]
MLDDKQTRTETVLNPVGYPPKVSAKSPAPRSGGLSGRKVFLVDTRFDDSAELLKQVAAWFAEHMPDLETEMVQLARTYADDDPDLWERIKAENGVAIVGVGHCSTCAPAVTTHAITLETKYGVPAVAVHTEKFDRVVRSVARMGGLPQQPFAFVPQPVMGKTEAELQAYVAGDDPRTGLPVMQEIITALTEAPPPGDKQLKFDRSTPREVDFTGTEEELQAAFIERNWTDFLPIVIPTDKRVEAMLQGTSRKPDEVVGRMEPTKNRGQWEYTVEKVAVNAVMAGAKPEYFPVILALAASGVTARGSTSSSGAAMAVVNGPIRHEIGMNCGIGAMGPYNHANATIGRAYGLVSQNGQGGSVPGETYMGSLGSGHTYQNLTFAENEERSPWEPLHVQHGHKAEDSTVSIFFGNRTTTFSLGLRETHWQEHVRDMLLGTDQITAPILVLDPICARQFVTRGGFDTKEKLIDWIHDTARMPAKRFWDLQLVQNYVYPHATYGVEPLATKLKADPDELIPIFLKERINVVVTGGEANGYWQIYGARPQGTFSIDAWR